MSTPSTWQPSPRRRSSPRGSSPTRRRRCWRASAAARASRWRSAWRAWCGTSPARGAAPRPAGLSRPVARRSRRRRCRCLTPSRWTDLVVTAYGQIQPAWWRCAELASSDRSALAGRWRHQMDCSTARPHCRMTSHDHSNSHVHRRSNLLWTTTNVLLYAPTACDCR